jgi:predicted Rossmann fold flavoprotein
VEALPDYEVGVIGGGAAGICAAISAARKAQAVVICEKMPAIGKKLLATGNGRCNLLNETLEERFFNPGSRELVKRVFGQFGGEKIRRFFADLGLYFSSVDGRVFPVTQQAATVLKLLEKELNKLKVMLELSFECTAITVGHKDISLLSRGRRTITCRKVVLAGGGKSYPSFGSTGSLMRIAEELGHTLIAPVPCAVPLIVKDPLCQVLQGQRIAATARSVIAGEEGRAVAGDLLFTRYGLSGTCVLDVSEELSIALNRRGQKDVALVIDLVPFLSGAGLKKELRRRLLAGWEKEQMLVGILPNKMSQALQDLFSSSDLEFVVRRLKERIFRVSATRGWNEAEFTAGGVNLREINILNLESKIRRGLYFAGEMLDVNGARGGYNLAWAWASGLLAGETR